MKQEGSKAGGLADIRNMNKRTCSQASFGQFKSAVVDLYKSTISKELSSHLDMLVRSYGKLVAKKKRAGVMSAKEGRRYDLFALLGLARVNASSYNACSQFIHIHA